MPGIGTQTPTPPRPQHGPHPPSAQSGSTAPPFQNPQSGGRRRPAGAKPKLPRGPCCSPPGTGPVLCLPCPQPSAGCKGPHLYGQELCLWLIHHSAGTPQVQGRYKAGKRQVEGRYKAGTRQVQGRYMEGTKQVTGRNMAGTRKVQIRYKAGTRQE